MLNLGLEVWFAFQMGDAKSLKEFTTAIASSSRFLPNLGIPTEIAQRDACRMEHAMSEESYQALKKELSSKMDVQ